MATQYAKAGAAIATIIAAITSATVNNIMMRLTRATSPYRAGVTPPLAINASLMPEST